MKRSHSTYLSQQQSQHHHQFLHLNEKVERIYLVSIDASDCITTDEHLKRQREHQVITILSGMPNFLKSTLFVILICETKDYKVLEFFETFGLDQKFSVLSKFLLKQQIFLEEVKEVNEFEWAKVFQSTSTIVSQLKQSIQSINQKVSLDIFMFICGGNSDSSCKPLKKSIFDPSDPSDSINKRQRRWYMNKSTKDNHHQMDHIGNCSVWIFILPDMILFNNTKFSLNEQKKLIKSINEEIKYEGIVALEYPQDELTLHTLLTETPTISTSQKGMNTAINNKINRMNESHDRIPRLKSIRNQRFLLTKSHIAIDLLDLIKQREQTIDSTQTLQTVQTVDNFLSKLIYTLPDLKVIINELTDIISSSEDKQTKCNLLAILVDNQGCWNHFIGDINSTNDPHSITKDKPHYPRYQFCRDHQREINSKIFNYLSTIFIGRPNYENERFLLIQYFSKVFFCSPVISSDSNVLIK